MFTLEKFQCVTRLYLSCRECYENNGLYHALQLEAMFNINSFLNKTVVSVSFPMLLWIIMNVILLTCEFMCMFHDSTTTIWPKCLRAWTSTSRASHCWSRPAETTSLTSPIQEWDRSILKPTWLRCVCVSVCVQYCGDKKGFPTSETWWIETCFLIKVFRLTLHKWI